jgi:hypothetical protein
VNKIKKTVGKTPIAFPDKSKILISAAGIRIINKINNGMIFPPIAKHL